MGEAIPLAAARRSTPLAWPAVAFMVTLVVGALAASVAHKDLAAAAGDIAVAVTFVTGGAIVGAQARSARVSGALMVATGVAWLLGSLADELALLHRGPLVQLLITAPGGRPRTWLEWLVVIVGYVSAAVPDLARDDGATLALAGAIGAVAVGRWARAAGVQRRARAVPAAATVTIALVLSDGAVRRADHAEALIWWYEAVLVLTAVALCVDLRRSWVQETVTRVVIDLGGSPRGSLTEALARAVGDPSLVVGYELSTGVVVDERGRRIELPIKDGDCVVTPIEAGEAVSAILVHDRAALRAPGLADSVAAAVRLALHNVELESRIRAHLRDVEASRARLLAVRDSERRDLEARLTLAADGRLARAARLLNGLEGDPEPLVRALPRELRRARNELARFAAGVHPVGLETGGLPLALEALAARVPVQVDLTVARGRLTDHIELAAWFVCSEALANVVKHAAAARVTIRVERSGSQLRLTITDDGRGGADPAAGRGLRGLAARVEAVGGNLEVGDVRGGGTRLRAWLPAEARP